MKKLLLSIILLLFAIVLRAQSPHWQMDTLTVDNGLAADAVRSLLKDDQGFMWFGTIIGLHRYDGYTMKTFQYDPANPDGPAFKDIRDMAEDHNGSIWIGSRHGLHKFDPKTEKFKHYAYEGEDAGDKFADWIERVCIDREGFVWAGSVNKLIRFDPRMETYKRYHFVPLGPACECGHRHLVTCIYEDHEGTLWVGTGNQVLLKMDRRTGISERYLITPADPSVQENFITNIFEDSKNNLWITTHNGIYQFDRLHGTYRRVLDDNTNPDHPEDQRFVAITEDKERNYWIRTHDGVYCYDQNFDLRWDWKHTATSLPIDIWKNIRTLLPDESGNIWFCLHWRGIVKLSPSLKKFRFYKPHPSYEAQFLRGFYLDKEDVIWMSSSYGLSRYDRKNNDYTLFRHDPENPNSLSSDHAKFIYRDHKGNLWVSTRFGLNRLVPSGNDQPGFVHYLHNPQDQNSIANNNVYRVFTGPDNTLLINTNAGIDVYDYDHDNFLHLSISTPNLEPFSPGNVMLTEPDKMWTFDPDRGLFLIYFPLRKTSPHHVTADSVVQFDPSLDNLPDFRISDLNNIFKDASGFYWFSTSFGLYKLLFDSLSTDESRLRVANHYTKENGLCHSQTAELQADKEGILWIGTANGLSKFDPSTEIFTNYDRSDGLLALDLDICSAKSIQGELFFRTSAGLLAFLPDSIRCNPERPPVVITQLKIFNKTVPIGGESLLTRSISHTTDVELPYNQNFLSFEFAALNYVHSQKNQYKYMMEGLDEGWIVAGTRRNADYPDLKPGNYTFRVIGSNNDNIWNTEGASLNITILPPWWTTAYAYTGYVFLLLIAVFGYIRFRTDQIRKERNRLEKQVKERTEEIKVQKEKIEAQKELLQKQNEKIREMDRVKTRFFTNVSHEFRTPLTMIQGPAQDLIDNARLNKKELGKLQTIARNAKRLLNLVNQLLDIAKLESGAMKLKLGEADVMASLRAIAGTFSSLAEAKGIVYNRFIPGESYTTWFDPGTLEKILTNLLANAFKFTPEAGEITFKACLVRPASTEEPVQIECTVSDQGPGIPVEEQEKIFSRFYQVEGRKTIVGTGIGLSLVKDLVNLCHGDISLDSSEDKGSIFTVRLPLGKDHLKEDEYILIERTKENPGVGTIADTADQEFARPSDASRKPGKPIVLLVEDSSDIRSHIREHLENAYEVVESVNGHAGLSKSQEIIPDLVITDLMMPVMDGVEMCKQIKSDERTSHIPVIMLTAKATMEDKLKGLETGADDYIAKPFDMQELIIRVANLIEQRRKLRERYSREINLEPRDIAITPVDEAFLQRAIGLVEERISDEHFDIEQFQDAMNMSHSTLFRKLQALTDQSPTVFIRNIRLKRGAQLLREHYGNVAKVSYEVGFNNPSYFSKCFRELYGVSPVDYAKQETSFS